MLSIAVQHIWLVVVRNTRGTLVRRARHIRHMLIHCKVSLEVLIEIGDACEVSNRKHEVL
jgi:hypothetical protein